MGKYEILPLLVQISKVILIRITQLDMDTISNLNNRVHRNKRRKCFQHSSHNPLCLYILYIGDWLIANVCALGSAHMRFAAAAAVQSAS